MTTLVSKKLSIDQSELEKFVVSGCKMNYLLSIRSSHPEVFSEKDVPKIFAIHTGENTRVAVFSNKVESLKT